MLSLDDSFNARVANNINNIEEIIWTCDSLCFYSGFLSYR